MLKWLKRGLVLIAGLAGCAAAVYALLPQPVAVEVGRVGRGSLQATIDEEGKTRIKDRYVVSSPSAGLLLRVELKAGDPVKANRTLLTSLDPPDPSLLDVRAQAEAHARVKAAEATIQRVASQLEEAHEVLAHAETDFGRAQKLLQRGTISTDEFEHAELQWQNRSEEYRAARFARQVAEYELELAKAAFTRTHAETKSAPEAWKIDLLSPIDGRVLRVLQESAAIVQPGTPIIELGDPANLEVVVDVLSQEAARVPPRAKVWLERWGGERPLRGRVRLIEPSGFTKISALGIEEQRVNVIVDLLDPPSERANLGDAFRVEAKIVLWESSDVLKVPASALFRREGEWAVFIAREGRARLQHVDIGERNDLEAQVLAGLTENDSVIVHPSDRIDDGVRIAQAL
ncbi:MAG TPA: HlyD family efflux transporter periplasmic adaptor subunit [Pirellulales bacterium]|nr:HlyD family efflux transporter periplasmic adaptor subunit [Pirellulales bacterium]